MSAPIHQEVVYAATADRVYEALISSQQFSAFTGEPSDMSRVEGGPFSGFGGHIVGRNIELVPNRRIVQAWRVTTWPDGAYSIVRFELDRQGSQTRLVMDHAGFPEAEREHLDSGWSKRYWEPLRKYLG